MTHSLTIHDRQGVLSFGPLSTLALASGVTAIPVVCHLAGQPMGIAVCVLLALLVANFATAAAPMTLIFAYLFQNLFVAFLSPQISDFNEFNSIRAYNFVLTAAMWIVVAGSYWMDRARYDARLRS